MHLNEPRAISLVVRFGTHYGVGIDYGDNIFETQSYAVHFFDHALVDALAIGWNLETVEPDEEGSLPRRIWRVT